VVLTNVTIAAKKRISTLCWGVNSSAIKTNRAIPKLRLLVAFHFLFMTDTWTLAQRESFVQTV